MKKTLIIGASSTTGKYFYKLSVNNGYEYFFCDSSDCYNSDIIPRWNKIDFRDYNSIYNLIQDIHPNEIYNFAGTFSNDYIIDYQANVLLPKYILDSIVKLKLKTRILLIGSAAEYGKINDNDNPVTEDHPLNPISIYGLTKVYQTNLMKYYYNYFALDIIMARPSNLLGKGFSRKLFIGNLYDQIEKYKKCIIKEITIGNLEHKRDYISIEEAIKDYKLIMEHGQPGEIYNVAKGQSIKIKDLLLKIIIDNGLSLDIVKTYPSITKNKNDIKDIFLDIRKLSSLRIK